MPSLAPQPKFRFYTAGGLLTGVRPLVGGKVYFYEAGTNIPKNTFTDESGLTLNTNPVVLDARGEADIWLGDGAYKIIVRDAAGVQQGGTVDNVKGIDQIIAEIGAEFVTYDALADDGAELIDFDALRNYRVGSVGYALKFSGGGSGLGVLVTKYLADPTGVADSTAAFIQCIAENSLTLVPPGTYKLTGNIPVPEKRYILGAGAGASVLDKQTDQDLFLINGWYFGIDGITVQINGDTYATGAVFVAAVNTNYHWYLRCAFLQYKVPLWRAAGGEAGKQMRVAHCELKPVASATFTPAFQLSAIQDIGAGNRRFIDVNGQGGMIVDLGGSLETFLNDCFTNGIGNSSTLADIFYISLCRNALVGSAQYIKGQGANIIGNQLPGPVILRNSGTNSLTYSDNKEHSLSWGNGKYNNICMQAPYRWTQVAAGAASSVGAAGVANGSVSLPVADATIFQIGQYIEVQTGTFWRSVIDGIETTTVPHMLTLRRPSPQPYAGGAVIARFRYLLCDANVITTCTQATVGLYTVVVSSAVGLVEGRSCFVQNAGRGQDSILTTIVGISGTTITLADPIEFAISGVAFIAQGAPIDPGDGSLTMQVDRSGKRVSMTGRMVVGSSGVNLGSGNWNMWLPALSDPQFLQPVYASAIDVSAPLDYYFRGTLGAGEGWVTFTRNGTVVRFNQPMTWAANDVFDFNIEYEAW